jgi:hypothetical protein
MTMKAEVYNVDPFLLINYLIGCLVHASTVDTPDYSCPAFRVPTWGWTDASKIPHVISISNQSGNRDCLNANYPWTLRILQLESFL